LLVKFSCGCVGLVGVQGSPDNRPLIVSACDGEGEGLSLYRRDMTDKERTPLPDRESERIVKALTRLIHDGHKYREVKTLLGILEPVRSSHDI